MPERSDANARRRLLHHHVMRRFGSFDLFAALISAASRNDRRGRSLPHPAPQAYGLCHESKGQQRSLPHTDLSHSAGIPENFGSTRTTHAVAGAGATLERRHPPRLPRARGTLSCLGASGIRGAKPLPAYRCIGISPWLPPGSDPCKSHPPCRTDSHLAMENVC